MKIAIFDHIINDSNAIGKCHREILARLGEDYDFTVFAIEFDNPNPQRIRFVRVPALRRPLLGLMVTFHIIAPLILWWHRHIKGEEFDLIQAIGGNFINPDLAYSHFCHRVYLKEFTDARPKTLLRRIYSWLYDSIVALLEPIIYERSKYIVTPSEGLATELTRTYKKRVQNKTHVISNMVNVHHMIRPTSHNSDSLRKSLGFNATDFLLVFVGAGHFERKGLPMLLQSMQLIEREDVKLIVVGGRKYMIEEYRRKIQQTSLKNRIRFVGFQRDIRPYLWASNLFVFPSAYEIFPLVALEAAAAGLPILSSRLYGVEEFLVNDYNGWQVERTPEAFAERITYGLKNRDNLGQMGENASRSVMKYSPENFKQSWNAYYQTIKQDLQKISPQHNV